MINTFHTGRVAWTLALIGCLSVFNTASAASFTGSSVPGGVSMVDLGVSSDPKPQARYGSKNVLVIEQDGHWKGLVGISLKTLPGNYIVSYQTDKESNKNKEVAVRVQPKTYPEQRIKMKQKKYVSPNKEQLARIKSEKNHMTKLFKIWRDTDVSVDLTWPVDGPLSSPFGLRRFFNDQPRNPHSGIDIAAPEGTVVFAPADGLVTLTHPGMLLSGGTIILDHGQGLSSTFLHLSEILVEAGIFVKQGDLIARIGATGRASGPHLDWRMNWLNRRVNPQLLIPPIESP